MNWALNLFVNINHKPYCPLLHKSRDSICYVSRQILAPPPLRLQKHADTRTHDSAHSPDLWYNLGLVTLPAPEGGDFVELIPLNTWSTRRRDCVYSKCILRFLITLSLVSRCLRVGETISVHRNIVCNSNSYYKSRTGLFVVRCSSVSIFIRLRDERPSTHSLIPDRSKVCFTNSSRPDWPWGATSLPLNGFWGLFPSG
jgi:hypothetical protein